MAHGIPPDEQQNYNHFLDCLSEPILRALAIPSDQDSDLRRKRRGRKERRRGKGKKKGGEEEKGGEGKGDEVDSGVGEMVVGTEDRRGDGDEGEEEGEQGDDLGEFIEFLSSQIFPTLPTPLRTLTHKTYLTSNKLQTLYPTPLPPTTISHLTTHIPPTAIDILESSSLLPPQSDTTDVQNFFTPVLNTYLTAITAPPPIWSTTRTSECELCGRGWIPLTYHHLIPRSTHERVLKRKWHKEEVLNSVMWLCRACHSFVHRLASNEELAKGFYTVELVREGGKDGEKRDEVDGWVKWVGGVRWKSR
ncbi:hypothetical protein DM02DRAFT_115159 [Periconia macrospinosa]|uniref:HNH domain-containing protein n=1 Tax=Periconia macrospinosa TaxID=97972 RepID=A0A2V1DER0_9PLEO|nr:hypothetical protein DM02DRAFT_115159 [Periconia macrospinosa]